MTTTADFTELGAEIDEVLAEATKVASLRAARMLCNDVGLRRKQSDLTDSLDVYDAALKDKREADQAADAARSEHANAVAEAAWALEDRFVVRSNKTWLALGQDDNGDDLAIPEDKQRSFDAAAKKDWIARETSKFYAVSVAAKALATAELRVAEARDGITVAAAAVQARRHLLDSAVAELSVLALALGSPRSSHNGTGER